MHHGIPQPRTQQQWDERFSSQTYSAAVRESSDFWEKLWVRDGALGWLLVASMKLEPGRDGGSMMFRIDGKFDVMNEVLCVGLMILMITKGQSPQPRAPSAPAPKSTLRVG
jgi:hypothetical protein